MLKNRSLVIFKLRVERVCDIFKELFCVAIINSKKKYQKGLYGVKIHPTKQMVRMKQKNYQFRYIKPCKFKI